MVQNHLKTLDLICPKKLFPVENRKSKHHHWILLIQISPCTKFLLKMTILIFWTKFTQKGCFRSKTEKSHFCMIVTYCIKLFQTAADRRNSILMSLLLLVAETIITRPLPCSKENQEANQVYKSDKTIDLDTYAKLMLSFVVQYYS